jgi:predicted metalloprotease with PDZ domain
VTIEAPRRNGTVVTSYGVSRTGTATIRTRDGADRLRHALYFGGAFDVREARIHGKPLYIARRGKWRFDADPFAAATERLIATHRAFWNDFAFDHFVIELLPTNLPQGEWGGTGLVNAFTMYGSRDFNVPGDAFDFLVGHEHLHTWIPQRFGAMGSDEALRYWFSEGFTDFYTHRLLVKSGFWPLEIYAEALNRKISRYLASPAHLADNRRVAVEFFSGDEVGQLPYQRGEFIALRWHGELTRRGHGGLDPLMRGLMLARASDESPTTPLATTRLLERLETLVGDSARRDVERFVERGESYPFDGDTLGPCFALEWSTQPARWRLGLDIKSLATGVVGGVEPDGPAYRAGLRDGQKVLGYGIYRGDVAHDSAVTIRDDDGTPRQIAYRPAEGEIRVPLYRVVDGARDDDSCRRWFGLAAGESFAPPDAPSPASSATRPRS